MSQTTLACTVMPASSRSSRTEREAAPEAVVDESCKVQVVEGRVCREFGPRCSNRRYS
jgi:hypothetical protein